MSRYKEWSLVLSCAAAVAVGGRTLLAESNQQTVVQETFVTYSTQQDGQLELNFDAAAFARQGWSLSPQSVVLPMAVAGDHAVEVVTRNGEFLEMGGSPLAVGGVELISPEGLSVNVANFALPISGHRDVMFMTSDHPVFELVGESLEVQIGESEFVLSGLIKLHDAATDIGLDTSVGVVGDFVLSATLTVLDVDPTVVLRRHADSPDDPHSPELPGADVTVGSLPNIHHWTTGGAVNGMRAYSVATTSCNIGSQPLDWFQGPNPRHPVIAQAMYRLRGGRFEQLGQSWVKHGFCALQQSLCQACQPVGGCCCQQLGIGCSDPYSSSRNGTFTHMGPKSEINVHMGTNLGNHASAQGNVTLRGRIQVRQDDLDPALNPGALYYSEGQYVAQDDAQFGDMTNDNNNASYRRFTVNGSTFAASVIGATVREEAAIYAWKANDPAVALKQIDVPNEGRFILGTRVTDMGDGTWHYEYALHNLNSDRAASSFSVAMEGGATLTNVGFHDVDYHSGEPYDLADWDFSNDGTNATWSTHPFAENQNANALRWGTLYNFRFDANSPPAPGFVTIGLFKPGTPSEVNGTTLVPSFSCAAPDFKAAAAGVSFADRAYDGYIDPKRESTDGNTVIGLSVLTVEFTTPMENADGSPLSAGAFAIEDTAGSPPSIVGINSDDGQTVVIELSGPISLQAWTTLSVSARSQCGSEMLTASIDIGYLPGDIDQSGTVNPLDLLKFKQYVNNVSTPPVGTLVDFIDIDRSGTVTPLDLLSFKQLINGVMPPATQVWANQSLPAQP